MIFRKFINGEEVSFCNVNTPEEALETLLDPHATDYDEIMEHLQETIYGWQAALGKKEDGEPGDIIEIKYFAKAEDETPSWVRKVKEPVEQLERMRKAHPELFKAPKGKDKYRCPKCKKHDMEISSVDMNLDRNGIRVFITCSDNVCPFRKVLELSISDIIGVGKDPETEAESRGAIKRAMEKVRH